MRRALTVIPMTLTVLSACCHAQTPLKTADTLLLWHCESEATVDYATGDPRVALTGGSITVGKHGNGLHLAKDQFVTVASKGNVLARQGTVMFWFRPDWSTKDKTSSHSLLSWRWADGRWADATLGDGYCVLSDGWWESGGGADRLYLVFENQLYAHTSRPQEFVVGRWIHVAFTWEFTDHPIASLFINGERSGTANGKPCSEIPRISSAIHLGTDRGADGGGERSAEGTFDSIAILSRALSSNEIREAFRNQEPEWAAIEAEKFQWLRDGLAKPYTPRRTPEGQILESRALLDEGNGWITPEGAQTRIERLKQAGFNVYIPCIWHGRGTTWPSELAPQDAGTAKLLNETPTYDPLNNLIASAHAAGIEVHPWFCVMYRDERWPHMAEFAEEGTPKGAFEAHSLAFRKRIIELMLEVIERYDVDGINLDYIRTKGTSKSATARQSFREQFGLELEEALKQKQANGWGNADVLAWQARAIDEIVETISTRGRALKPSLIVSIDGHPPKPGEMRSPQGRNGVEWVAKGWIDVLYTMDYNKHLSWKKADLLRAAFPSPSALVTIAGNYDRMPDRKVVPRDATLVADLVGFLQRRNHGNGLALYLYSMLDDAQITALRKGPFRQDAIPAWTSSQRR